MKQWRQHWYTRAIVWMALAAPFAVANSVLDNALGWSHLGYILGFVSGVVICTVDHMGDRNQ